MCSIFQCFTDYILNPDLIKNVKIVWKWLEKWHEMCYNIHKLSNIGRSSLAYHHMRYYICLGFEIKWFWTDMVLFYQLSPYTYLVHTLIIGNLFFTQFYRLLSVKERHIKKPNMLYLLIICYIWYLLIRYVAFLGVFHIIFGRGFPLTLQLSDVLLPRETVLFCGFSRILPAA